MGPASKPRTQYLAVALSLFCALLGDGASLTGGAITFAFLVAAGAIQVLVRVFQSRLTIAMTLGAVNMRMPENL